MENFKVLDLNLNEGNRSSIIKFKDQRFLLKNIGIGSYGTERIANLYVILPNGDKALVQTICFLKKEAMLSNEGAFRANDCFMHEQANFEKAIEYSINFINLLYGE
jgi:hypothetical protein